MILRGIKGTDIGGEITAEGKCTITLLTSLKTAEKLLNEVKKDKEYNVEIKQYRKKRSLDANAYLWTLCDKISRVIPDTTKEDVYRNAIHDVGVFEIVPIKDEAVERWMDNWKVKGLGWIAEVLHPAKTDGYTLVINYYGSSTYNAKEMSRLIDNVVMTAKECGVETLTPDELEQMKAAWKG
uniref:hypothetical protein n=1 Tax=[Ruminococcus] torques TaxID=33039 RepID=UPI00402AE40A